LPLRLQKAIGKANKSEPKAIRPRNRTGSVKGSVMEDTYGLGQNWLRRRESAFIGSLLATDKPLPQAQ